VCVYGCACVLVRAYLCEAERARESVCMCVCVFARTRACSCVCVF